MLTAAAPITFNAPQTYLTGGAVTSVAAGDFNGDGFADVAVTSLNVNTVSIFLGHGDGTFQPPVAYPVGAGPDAIAVGDFNHDGKLDLAVASSGPDTGTLSILFGNGDGAFQAAVGYPLGRALGAIAIADFNHDGNSDLAVVDSSGLSQVYILFGNSQGAFHLAGTYKVGYYPASIVVGDFNGDGNPDLAVACGGYDHDGQGVMLLYGKGNGGFENPKMIYAGSTPSSVAVADFNNDGKLDLAVADYDSPGLGSTNAISLLLGNGDGTFQKPTTMYVIGRYPDRIAAADLNNDGKMDLAVGTAEGVTFLFGNGHGSFGSPANATTISGFFALADFNNDGQLDLALASGGLTVLLRAGNGFPRETSFYAGGTPASIAATDFNRDGKLDLIVGASNPGSIAILLGNGDGTFQPATFVHALNNPRITVADINGDGNPDIVVCAGSVSVLPGNGHGQVGPAQVIPNLSASYLAVADFNGDGKLDLVASTSTGVVVLYGKGDGTFRPPVLIAAMTDAGFLAIGDFDHDGKPDIAVARIHSEAVSIVYNDGDGTFSAPVNYGVGEDPSSIAVGNFVSPGSQDLAVVNYGSPFLYSTISVLVNGGSEGFQPAVNYLVGAGPQYVAVGDFDGDGTADWPSPTSGPMPFRSCPETATAHFGRRLATTSPRAPARWQLASSTADSKATSP